MENFEKNGKKNICLIGMMGSGKSIIGKELSKIYNFNYYDSDLEIEKKIGNNIKYIFENHGEVYFREAEEQICLDLLKKEKSIISLGGGSVVNLNIRKIIKKNSVSIYLKVDNDELFKRLRNSKKRPLLNNVDKKNKLEQIYKQRKQFYNKADLIIDNNLDRDKVIKEIIIKLKNK